jgi:hypothetical protein
VLSSNRDRGVNLVNEVSVTIQGGTHVAALLFIVGHQPAGIHFDASGQPQLPDLKSAGPDRRKSKTTTVNLLRHSR